LSVFSGGEMVDKMKAIVKTKAETCGTEMLTLDIPRPGPSDVLIKIDTASICGTDVHIFNWDLWASSRIIPPLIYGHEFVGYVVEKGKNVTNVREGDYVSGECHIFCGRCYQCKAGQMHICQNMKVFGIDVPGVFAEYACIPALNVWLNDKDVPSELCSVQDPFGNAVHSVYSTDIEGKDIAVLGLGPIGIMCVMLCKNLGAANIFAVEKKNSYRSNLAKKVGATYVFGEGETDTLTKQIYEITNGKGVDAVLEMSGSKEALIHGLGLVKKGGCMILLGVYNEPIALDVSNQIVFKYVTLKGIYGRRIWGDWQKMKELLKNSEIRKDLETIITHRFTFDKFFDAMEIMRSGQSGKVVLTFGK